MLVIADQVQQFKEVVYTTVGGFFEPREVAAMRMEIDRWMASEMPQDVSTGPATRQNLQLIPLHDRSKLFRALPFAPKVIDGVGALIGHPLVKILDQMFLKPAQSGMGTSWHTDNAYFHLSDPMAGLAMWIAVDDAKPENGTLKVIPGRFQEKFPHTRDPDSNHHIRTQIDETRAVHRAPCTVNWKQAALFSFVSERLTHLATTQVGMRARAWEYNSLTVRRSRFVRVSIGNRSKSRVPGLLPVKTNMDLASNLRRKLPAYLNRGMELPTNHNLACQGYS